MAKIVYVEWMESGEVDIIGVYTNERKAYRVRENKEYELKEEGYDTEDYVRVWIDDADIVSVDTEEDIRMILDEMETYTVGRLKDQMVCLTVEELQNYIDSIRKLLE